MVFYHFKEFGMKKKCLFAAVCILYLCFSFPLFCSNTDNTKVYVGIYLADISSFNLSEGRFRLDAYVWCKWLGSESVPPIDFANGEIESLDEVAREQDGNWRSVRYHVQGTFRGTFPLQHFPFDSQTLKIEVSIPKEAGRIVPDLAGSGMAEEFSITGWLYNRTFKAEIEENIYYSDFGSIKNEGNPYESTSVIFKLKLKRPLLPYLIKFFMPLLIIVLISLSVYFINPDELEANVGIGVTSLLTCVAFQFSLSESIPNVSYMVTADKFFIVSYIIVLFNIIETVYTFNIYKSKPKLSMKIEHVTWKGIALIMFAGIILVTITDIILPGLPKQPEQQKISTVERPVSAKSEFTYSTLSLKTYSNDAVDLIQRGLYHEIAGGEKVPHLVVKVPDLTNEYVTFRQDGSVVVRWQLKPGLKWGDGTPISSDDMLFSINAGINSNRTETVKIDKLTMDVIYRQRRKSILEKFPLYPKEHFESVFNENGYDGIIEKMKTEPPPLDGPYILTEFDSKNRMVFEKNPYFAGTEPLIERIIFKLVKKSDGGADTLVKEKKTDAVGYLSVSTYNKVKNADGYAIKIDPYNLLNILQPDLGVFPFNDLNFRKALAHGIDKNKIARILYGENGVVAHSYRPPYEPDYNETLDIFEYNPAKARKYVKKVKGLEPVQLIVWERMKASPSFAVIPELQRQLKEIGIETEINYVKSASQLFTTGSHGGLLFLNRSTDFDLPRKFWNIPDYSVKPGEPLKLYTKEVMLLDEAFSRTMFEERRVAISKQLQEKFNETLPVIPLCLGDYKSVYNARLVNWEPKAVSSNIFWNVEHWYFEE